MTQRPNKPAKRNEPEQPFSLLAVFPLSDEVCPDSCNPGSQDPSIAGSGTGVGLLPPPPPPPWPGGYDPTAAGPVSVRHGMRRPMKSASAAFSLSRPMCRGKSGVQLSSPISPSICRKENVAMFFTGSFEASSDSRKKVRAGSALTLSSTSLKSTGTLPS